jgi:hypothetical protein
MNFDYFIRVVRKLQFLNNFLNKNSIFVGLARKNAGLVKEPTGFLHKSIDFHDFKDIKSG